MNNKMTIEQRPNDIDITLAWDPKKIYNQSNKIGLSHFMTEKFWTITYIKKDKIKKEIQYEVTPLRTEWNYQDFRHPWEINRSNDIILDAKRRDFTINSLYFFADTNREKKEQVSYSIDEKELLKWLKDNEIFAIKEQNLLIIQNQNIITDRKSSCRERV